MPLNNKTRWNIIKGQNELYRQFVLWASLFKLTNVTLFSRKRKLQHFILRIALIQIRSWEYKGGAGIEKVPEHGWGDINSLFSLSSYWREGKGQSSMAVAQNNFASVPGTISACGTMSLQARGVVCYQPSAGWELISKTQQQWVLYLRPGNE